jgi:hypothetical protein
MQQLETDTPAFIDAHNANPKPFRWTKSPDPHPRRHPALLPSVRGRSEGLRKRDTSASFAGALAATISLVPARTVRTLLLAGHSTGQQQWEQAARCSRCCDGCGTNRNDA